MTGAPAMAPDPAAASERESIVEAIDAVLPQTQCRRCGEPDCRRYAEALADGRAEIDRCPPGGAEGIVRLAAITGRAPRPLDAACGQEGPRLLAVIDEALCIGCTLCIQACPVDCIVGAARRMHTVIESQCTGCELCVPVCPVDCIALLEATPGRSGWQAWSPAQAAGSRMRYRTREARLLRRRREREQRLAARAGRPLEGADAASPPAAAAVASVPTPDAARATKPITGNPAPAAAPASAVPNEGDPASTPTPEDRKRATIAAALARARARRGA